MAWSRFTPITVTTTGYITDQNSPSIAAPSAISDAPPDCFVDLQGGDAARVILAVDGDASGVVGTLKVWGTSIIETIDGDSDLKIVYLTQLLATCAAPAIGTQAITDMFGFPASTVVYLADDFGTVTVSDEAKAFDYAFGTRQTKVYNLGITSDPTVVELYGGANLVAELLVGNVGHFSYLSFSLSALQATPTVTRAYLCAAIRYSG
jgi:hypothetical protein